MRENKSDCVLVIAEHDQKRLQPATLSAINAARKLISFTRGHIVVLVAGHNCLDVVNEVADISDVEIVVHVDAPQYAYCLAENLAGLIVDYVHHLGQDSTQPEGGIQLNSVTHIIASATTFGKNLLPRIAALLDVAMFSDIIDVVNADTFVRPVYAGNALVTLSSCHAMQVLSVRGTAFLHDGVLVEQENASCALVVTYQSVPAKDYVRFVKQSLTSPDHVELTSAKIVISGGRGLQEANNFKLLERIADYLGAAVGATRAAVDAGFVPNDYQIGQTGKQVAPELYIAVGISGAIQHLAGMSESKVIVAINKDADAPIFEVADYIFVGDLFEILPELEKLLST